MSFDNLLKAEDNDVLFSYQFKDVSIPIWFYVRNFLDEWYSVLTGLNIEVHNKNFYMMKTRFYESNSIFPTFNTSSDLKTLKDKNDIWDKNWKINYQNLINEILETK